eukprot:4331335-Lingulodinium_polyedra.AAC.1
MSEGRSIVGSLKRKWDLPLPPRRPMPTIGRTKLPMRNCCYFTCVAQNVLHAPTVMDQCNKICLE